MPSGPTAPRSLAGLLAEFRPCFTAPTFQTFIGLVVGLIAQTGRRTVCGMLTGAGLEQVWHHSRAHRLFTNARWSADALGLVLADLIVTHLLPAGSPLTVAVDDTLFKRSGKKVFGRAWHHDGAANVSDQVIPQAADQERPLGDDVRVADGTTFAVHHRSARQALEPAAH